MTSTDADKLIAAARQATAERDAAFEEAARLLNPPPPPPVAVVADLLVQLKMVRGDRDALTDERDNAVEAMRTAAADWRAALDRVATAAGVGTDSTASIVADLVVDVIRRLSSDRDQMRVAREDAIEDLERLNAILSSAGIETTGLATGVADRVAAALLRPALPADLRAYLEARRDRLVDVSGLSAASEIAALTGWIASPTAEVEP